MPYIKVDVDKIGHYQQNVYNILTKVNIISSNFSNIASQLDFNVRNNSGIEKKLQNIESAFWDHKTVLQRANTFLSITSIRYINTESALYVNNNTSGNVGYIDINESPEKIEHKPNDILHTVPNNTPNNISANTSNNVSTVISQYSDEEREIVAVAAAELGIAEVCIYENIKQGLSSIGDVAEFIEGKAKKVNKFVKSIDKTVKVLTGSSKVLFTVKDGYVIVSKFARKSRFNNLVKEFHDGTGIGTRYTVDGIKGTPIIGKVYTVDQIAKKVDKVADTITAITSGVENIAEAGGKIADIWANDELSKKEKIIDTAAVAVTSAVGTALDVAAPFAGTAVKTAVTSALSAVIPGAGTIVGAAIGAVAGKIVEKGMELVSDVITSEVIVNQVSDSIEKVGDAVSSGVATVSNAAKELMESKNAGEAIVNTTKLVGEAVVAGTQVVATAVIETTKTVAKVAVETVKTAAKAVTNKVKDTVKKVETAAKKTVETAKKTVDTVKKWLKKW